MTAYKTLIGLHNKITRLNGVINPEGIDNLDNKLGGMCTIIKTHHYTKRQKYGHLASIIPQNKYRIVIGDATWVHTVPNDPSAYSAQALGVGNAAAIGKQFVAEHKVLEASYANYLGAEEATKELILYVIGNDAVAPLKRQYISFGDTTVLTMLDHLCMKTAIRMTTAPKHKYKTSWYNAPWDPTSSITAYFMHLDRFQISLGDRGIATSNEEKTMAAGALMWQSKMFTEDQMVARENKAPTNQTWANLQAYFTKKWLKRKQYSATTDKQSCFLEAALLAQKTAAAEEEGETQAMLFALLQEQHDKQMETMVATNKPNMDAMMERMNDLVAATGGKWNNDKENTPQPETALPPMMRPRDQNKDKNSAQTAKLLFITARTSVMSWKQTRTHAILDGSLSTWQFDMSQGLSK
jgi:hypothetical protein